MAAKGDGSLSFTMELDHKNLYKDVEKVGNRIEKLKHDIEKREGTTNSLAKDLKAAKEEADNALKAVEKLKAEMSQNAKILSGDVEVSPEEYSRVAARQSEITKELKAQEKVLQQKDKIAESLNKKWEKETKILDEQRQELDRQNEILAQTQTKLAKAQAMAPVNETIAGTTQMFNRFLRTLTNSMRRVFFFSLFYTGFRQIRDGMIAMVKTNDKAVAAMARLKGAFLTLVQPVIQVAIPAFTALANAVSRVVEMFAELTALLFGTTAKESAKAAEELYNEASGLNAVKKAAEEAEGSLASFDKINTIQTEPKNKKEDETIQPDFGAFDTSKFMTAFDRFRAMLVTGIALLVIGAILTFTGVNIPVGIMMMATGAAMIYAAVALNWNSMDGPTQQALAHLLELIGFSIAVIGVILLLTGHIPLGIALIVAGAYIFATGVMAANWNALDGPLRERLGLLAEIVAVFLAVLGVIVLLTGNIPLGVGLILAGILLFEIGEIAINWDSLGDTLREKLSAAIEKIGKTLIVIGILLLFVPGQILLGIGLIVAGYAALDTAEILLNWDSLGETLSEKLAIVVDKIAKYMIVFGILLLFVPSQQMNAIALIAGGVSILAAKDVYLNWDSFGDTLEERLINILDTIKYYMLVIGFLLLFVPSARIIGLGLIVAGIAVIAVTEVSEDENSLSKTTEEKLFALVKVISGALAVLGIILVLFGGPALWPLALGMFAVGTTIFGVALRSPDWNALKSKLVEMWNSIKRWFTTDVKKFLSFDYWKDKAATIIDGLVKGITSGISKVTKAIGNLVSKAWPTPIDVGVTSSSAASASSYPAAIRATDVPALARGAVIPANREFLAVLGDQRNGRNLEAPESLLREISQEGNGEIIALLTQLLAAVRAGQVIQVDGQTFGRTAQRTLNGITNASGKFALNW